MQEDNPKPMYSRKVPIVDKTNERAQITKKRTLNTQINQDKKLLYLDLIFSIENS